jgi:hypothetical protein
MVDDKEVKTPKGSSKETMNPEELSEKDLERTTGGAVLAEYSNTIQILASLIKTD